MLAGVGSAQLSGPTDRLCRGNVPALIWLSPSPVELPFLGSWQTFEGDIMFDRSR